MSCTNFPDGVGFVLRKAGPRVGTEKGKGLCSAQAVPKTLKLPGRSLISPSPKHRDHFSECPHSSTVSTRPGEETHNDAPKKIFVGRSPHHELFEDLLCFERNVAVLRPGSGEIETAEC